MSIGDNQNKKRPPAGEARGQTRYKPLAALNRGERFWARIQDILPDTVVLLLADGSLLRAKSLVLPNARIGDEAVFLVKDVARGRIFLELTRDGDDAAEEGAETRKHRAFDMHI